MEFENDEKLIEKLSGSRTDMHAAIKWLQSNGEWEKIVSINLSKLQMDSTIKAEVFLDCLTTLTLNIRKGRFKRESAVKTYFSGICRYYLLDRLTKQTNKAKHLVNMENQTIVKQEKIDPHKIEEEVRQKSIKDALSYLINQLNEECKKILGYVILGYTMQEIGDLLAFKTQTIKNKAGKCRSALRARAINNSDLMKEIKSLI